MAKLTKAFTVRLPEAAFDELHRRSEESSIPAAILARMWILDNLPGWQMTSRRVFDTGTDPDAPDLEEQRAVNRQTYGAQHPQGSRAERRKKKSRK